MRLSRAGARQQFERLLGKAAQEGMEELRLIREAAEAPADEVALKRLEKWLVDNKEKA